MSQTTTIPDIDFKYEANNWVRCQTAGAGPLRTEAATAEAHEGLLSNLRWAAHAEGIALLGDFHGEPGPFNAAQARQRLRTLAAGSVPRAWCEPSDREEFESILSQLDFEWKEDDGRWRTAANFPDGGRFELTANPVATGIEFTSTLADWNDDLEADCRAALIRFLNRANGALRFVRVVLDGNQVRAESTAMADRLDTEVPDAARAVATAVQVLRREINALRVPSVAQAYLAANDSASQ